jgi:ring-1,2-phenylacetyl-CoA epoxidase subunit PaaC
LSKATLKEIDPNVHVRQGGKQGLHSEHLGYILTELQYLQRSHPGADW